MTDKTMTIGACAFCYKGWSLEQALQVLPGMGFDHISVGANHAGGQINPIEAAANPKENAKAVKELALQYLVEWVELFLCPLTIKEGLSVEPNEPDDTLRAKMIEHFKGIAEFAASAGFQNIMSVPGNPQEGMDEKKQYDLSVDSLNQMVAIARDAGVVLTIEPHRWSILQEVDDVKRMLADVPGLKLTMDYAHFVGKGVAEEALFDLHDATQHLHARPAHSTAFSCPYDENTIDFAAIIADLKKRGWQGMISTECFGDPATDDQLAHPAMQNLLMAADVARAIG
ncbi:MAG: sugar phosphate isomerase/epimerase family protein [Candidatus Sumerlaeia bacterium]